MSMLWRGNHLVSDTSNVWFFSYSRLLELKLLSIKEAANSVVKIPRIISLFKAWTHPLLCTTNWFTLTEKMMLYNNALIGLMELEQAGSFSYIVHVSLNNSKLLIWIYSIYSLPSVMDMISNIFIWIMLLKGWIRGNESAGLSCIFKNKLKDLCTQGEETSCMNARGALSE